MIVVRAKNEQETNDLAQSLGAALRPGDIVALDGPLGAGKTTFVRGLAVGIGVPARAVSSPTFVLSQEYESDCGRVLAHLDFYRLNTMADLASVGWDELVASKDAIIAVEWAERLPGAFPDRTIRVSLSPDLPGDDRATNDRLETQSGRVIRIAIPAARSDLEFRAPSTEKRCPICAEPVLADAETAPFCSARCRLVDLGKWFDGGYSMSRPLGESDLLDD